MVDVGGLLFFNANDGISGYELWKSDGTAAGTVLVRNIRTGSAGSNPGYLTNSGGTLYFAANDGTTGTELWKSDGTAAGTVLVSDLVTGSTSGLPRRLTDVSGTLYFSRTQSGVGTELWEAMARRQALSSSRPFLRALMVAVQAI